MLITEATPGSSNHSVDNNKTTPQISCSPEDARFVSIKTTGHALIIKLFLAFSFKVAAVALVVLVVLSSCCSADFSNEQKSASMRCGIRSRKG